MSVPNAGGEIPLRAPDRCGAGLARRPGCGHTAPVDRVAVRLDLARSVGPGRSADERNGEPPGGMLVWRSTSRSRPRSPSRSRWPGRPPWCWTSSSWSPSTAPRYRAPSVSSPATTARGSTSWTRPGEPSPSRYAASVSGSAPAPVAATELELLAYLRPSRYCPSDRLVGWATGEFGHLGRGGAAVQAITDWIAPRTAYVLGSSGPTEDRGRHAHGRAGRLPRLRPPRRHDLPRPRHPRPDGGRVRPRPRSHGLPRRVRGLHRWRLAGLRRHPPGPPLGVRAHRHRP